MQELETTLKPFILDLLAIIERTQALAAGDSCPDPQTIAHAGQLLSAAFSALPDPDAPGGLDGVRAALPAAQDEPEEVPMDGWLLGDDDGGFLGQ